MKKLISSVAIILIVLTFAFGFNHQAQAATLKPVSDEITNLWEAIQSLISRVQILETKVADLFTQLANIQLIPGPQGPKGDKGESGLPAQHGAGNVAFSYLEYPKCVDCGRQEYVLKTDGTV